MTKCLIIGDMHIQCSNILQIDIFLKKLEEFLNKTKFDFIVSAGDLLHTHEKIHTIALNKAIEFLDLLTKYSLTYVLVGNHDLKSNQEFMTQDGSWLTCLKTHPNLIVVYKTIVTTINKETFTFCPYVPDKRFIEALSFTNNDWKKSICIFAHQTLNGAKMGAIIAENIEEWYDENPLCISGHIHTRHWVKENLLYVGSSLQHSFGETDKKSLTIFDSNCNPKCSAIYLDLPIKKTIYLDTSQLTKFDINTIINKINTIEYKIVVTGVVSEWKAFQKTSNYKKIIKHGRIVFKPNKLDFFKLTDTINKNHIQHSFKEILINNIKNNSNKEVINLMNELID